MSNLREVKDDLLKDWLLFREDEISTLSCEEDRKHWFYFDEISKKILNSIPKQNRAYVQKNLIFLMIISWIILAIGMRSIIGMGLLMVCRWLWDVLRNR